MRAPFMVVVAAFVIVVAIVAVVTISIVAGVVAVVRYAALVANDTRALERRSSRAINP